MAIYHLVWEREWSKLVRDGLYRAESLETEGFIHATRELDELVNVANRFYSVENGDSLLLLSLDEAQIECPIRDEDPGCEHLYPHVYGPIPLAAIHVVGPMRKGPTGWELSSNL